MSDGPIRVLHVLPWVLLGGVERRRVSLARYVSPAFEQRIACLTARGAVLQDLQAEGVSVDALAPDGAGITSLRTHAALHALVRRYRPHILHAAIFEGMVWGGIAGLVQRVPVVLLEETSFPNATAPVAMQRSAKIRALVRFLATRGDGIVGVSPAIGRYLADEVRIPAAKVHVVANGVEEFEVTDSATIRRERNRLGIPDDAIVLGGVGRIHEQHKRFGDLFLAVKELRRTRDVRALIVGEGRDLDALRRKAAELGVDGAVVFTGRREDRELFFGMMDVFVLSSATEAAPLALMEAMIAGRACVATTVGGVRDIAIDGESALLVPPCEPALLTGAIARVIEDTSLREGLARGARDRARSRFTARRYASDVEALYRERLRVHRIPVGSGVERSAARGPRPT